MSKFTKSTLTVLSATLAFFSVAEQANATMSFTFGPALPGSSLQAFDTTPLGTNNSSFFQAGVGTITLSGNASVVQGSSTNLYAAPYQDTTQYVQVAPTNGVATFTLSQPSHFFGLEWGSVDAGNTLTFYNGTTVIGTFGGQQIIDAANLSPGNQASDGTAFVDFTSSQDSAITSVVATSSNIAFEFDNVTVNPAPLPASLPMFLAAFGGLGLLAMRRKNQVAA